MTDEHDLTRGELLRGAAALVAVIHLPAWMIPREAEAEVAAEPALPVSTGALTKDLRVGLLNGDELISETLPVEFAPAQNAGTFNTNVVTWPPATENWGSVTHFGLYDGDTLLASGPLADTVTVNLGDSVEVQQGALAIKYDWGLW